MRDKTIVLGVSGGIAAFKAAALASRLTQMGNRVIVVMTRGAQQFVTPLTFQSLTHQAVYCDVFDEQDPSRIAHIALADEADLVLVAPATADILARAAHGLADDMLSSLLLAATCPVAFIPAMNVHMYEHPIVQHNLQTLERYGYFVAQTGTGSLACGYEGRGRLLEPDEIVEYAEMALAKKLLAGRRVLVSAGPTIERIDPVRYLTNDSTGTMGHALARAAWRMGARVTLVAGPTCLAPPLGVETVAVRSALEMREAVLGRLAGLDLLVMAAAVADYRPATVESQKIKKRDEKLQLELVRNPDILGEVATHPDRPACVIGFAAETHDTERYAEDKLVRKRLDAIIANDVMEPGAGFGGSTNRVTIHMRDGQPEQLPLMDKQDVAWEVLARAAQRL